MRQALPDPDIDRKNARLSPEVRASLLADHRRVNIIGTSGWIGRTTAALLHEALGPEAFADRVACFGSRAGRIDLDGLSIPQRPLTELAAQDSRPTLVFNLAFLTMDKVGAMADAEYARANQQLSETILAALEPIGADRVFVASSGAAAYADQADAAPALRLYGKLKQDQEAAFRAWALAAPQNRRLVTARIFSLSGPWINKPDVYALVDFILAGLEGRPIEIRAPMRVWRSYVAVRELVSLVLAELLAPEGPPVTDFATGGAAFELADIAAAVAQLTGGDVKRAAVTTCADNRYVADDAAYQALLSRHGITHVPLSDQIAETAAFLARTETLIPQRSVAAAGDDE